MPTYRRDDGKPIVQFNPDLEITPFVLFRRLSQNRAPTLVDGRAKPGSSKTLLGALPYPDPQWQPQSPEDEVVVFDDHGHEGMALVERLRSEGYPRVKLLFGGLDLYSFSLDPETVGSDTFLVSQEPDAE